MKRLLSVILATILALTLLASCSKDGVPSGMKLASSEKASYKLYVPKDWVIGSQESYTTANSKEKVPNVSATSYDLKTADADLEDWWKTETENLKEGFKDFKEISGEKTTLGGRDAMEKVYTAKLTGCEYKFHQVASIKDGYVYIVTFTCLPDTYEDNKETMNKIFAEFKF
ncbi:MAG: hypothetical protein IKM46_03370 [Clostridia bacterium]|nr:hypothetical protein [Clostridia bacterium]